ncbi:hydrogenase maturation protease [Chloroflexota bacterium]
MVNNVTSERQVVTNRRTVVLGVGNLLLRDEGVGIHLIQKLAEVLDRADVDIIDGGTDPDIVTRIGEDVDKLIVVDAASAGDKPGTIYRFDIKDLESGSPDTLSLHEIGIVDSIKMMSLIGKQPESVTVIGIEPGTIDFGLELSPELNERLPKMIEVVLNEIEDKNISMEEAR